MCSRLWKMQKHLSNEKEDYINSCFKCVGVRAYNREVIKGFGSCSYYPDGVGGGDDGSGGFDTFHISFVSQSSGHLGPEGNPPPHRSLLNLKPAL